MPHGSAFGFANCGATFLWIDLLIGVIATAEASLRYVSFPTVALIGPSGVRGTFALVAPEAGEAGCGYSHERSS
jgi:hypothetical protein